MGNLEKLFRVISKYWNVFQPLYNVSKVNPSGRKTEIFNKLIQKLVSEIIPYFHKMLMTIWLQVQIVSQYLCKNL